MRVQIGFWIERESRDERRCPSYYAADWEILRTKPGRYPLILDVVGGYMCPMPYWLLVAVDADRIDGCLYSGFGGHNFASTELAKEPKPLHVQMYDYQLTELVVSGTAEVFPEWTELLGDRMAFAQTLEWGKGLLAPEKAFGKKS
jgi:hypothetical protein